MANFAPIINPDAPIDPSDGRFSYGIDLVNVVDDGGTIVTPTATIEQAGTDAGVTLNSVAIVDTTKVTCRPTVSVGEQSDSRWNGDGVKYLVTFKVEDASGFELHRSGYLWFAQR